MREILKALFSIHTDCTFVQVGAGTFVIFFVLLISWGLWLASVLEAVWKALT